MSNGLEPSPARQAAAVAVAACVALAGALILGEYDFSGATPYIAGALFGLVIAEVTLSVARLGRPVLAAAAAGLSGLGMWFAAWISSRGWNIFRPGVGHGGAPIPGGAYIGMLLSIAVAAGWVSVPVRARRPRADRASEV